MDSGLVVMSRREIERAHVMRAIEERRLTQKQAATQLRLSVRQIEEGIRKTRAQRCKRIQQPRHRRDRTGELVQIDGSDHHWFENRGPKCVLLVYVDDATGKLMALRMCESALSYFHATRGYLERHGKPVAFYRDKAGVFRVMPRVPGPATASRNLAAP